MPFISDEGLARFAELCQRAHQPPPTDSVRLLFNPYWAFSPPMQEPSDVACHKSFVGWSLARLGAVLTSSMEALPAHGAR